MTKTIRAHFDGRSIVPDEPIDIPVNEPILVQLILPEKVSPSTSAEERRAAVGHFVSNPVRGVNLPDAALTRERIYGDE